jgi:hypothetical protein
MKIFRIPAITLVVGLLIIFGLSRYWVKASLESAGVIGASRATLRLRKPFHAQMRALQAVSQRYADSARILRQVAEAKGGLIRSLDTALTRAGTMRDSLLVVVNQREAFQSQAAVCCQLAHQWELAFRADSTRADRAEARVTDLEGHLANTLTIADCHLLGAKWLPRCMSRTASALLGAGIASAALILTHH